METQAALTMVGMRASVSVGDSLLVHSGVITGSGVINATRFVECGSFCEIDVLQVYGWPITLQCNHTGSLEIFGTVIMRRMEELVDATRRRSVSPIPPLNHSVIVLSMELPAAGPPTYSKLKINGRMKIEQMTLSYVSALVPSQSSVRELISWLCPPSFLGSCSTLGSRTAVLRGLRTLLLPPTESSSSTLLCVPSSLRSLITPEMETTRSLLSERESTSEDTPTSLTITMDTGKEILRVTF